MGALLGLLSLGCISLCIWGLLVWTCRWILCAGSPEARGRANWWHLAAWSGICALVAGLFAVLWSSAREVSSFALPLDLALKAGWLSVPVQVLAARFSGSLTRGRCRVAASVACLLTVSAVCGYLLWDRSATREAARILRAGRLAPLPPSATDIRTASWSGMFTGAGHLSFRATPEDIERFIANSPSLEHVAPKTYDQDHKHLPFASQRGEPADLRDDYFQPRPRPFWYDVTIRRKGRQYEIPAADHHNWGWVTINDETHTVYIEVVWS